MKTELEIVKFDVADVLTKTSDCTDPLPTAFE